MTYTYNTNLDFCLPILNFLRVTASDRDFDQPKKEKAATKMGEDLKSDQVPALSPAGEALSRPENS